MSLRPRPEAMPDAAPYIPDPKPRWSRQHAGTAAGSSDLAAVPDAELAGHFVLDAQRRYKDQPLYSRGPHCCDHVFSLPVDILAG